MEDAYLAIIITSLIFSAFFSGIEIAFYQLNPLQVELEKNKGKRSAYFSAYFLQRPTSFITNTLIGNNIALVVYGIIFTRWIEYIFPESGIFGIHNSFLAFIVLTLLSSLIVLIIAEFLPKALFIVNPNRMLSLLVLPFALLYYILYPINIIIISISKIVLLTMGVKVNEQKPSYDYYDLFHFVTDEFKDKSEEKNIELDAQIFRNVIELPRVKVRECMVPRPEIVAIEINENLENLKELFIESGHSKIIVYEDNIEQILGYVHITDLFDQPSSIKSILRPVFIVAEAMPANKLLKEFTSSNKSIGLVVDEYGGTAGIISIEDVLEEIFGEIEDEFDSETLKEVVVNDHEYIFSARLEIDYLNEKHNLDLPEGDYETLGGLILEQHGNIPERNEIISFDNFIIKIITASNNRIEEVLLKINKT